MVSVHGLASLQAIFSKKEINVTPSVPQAGDEAETTDEQFVHANQAQSLLLASLSPDLPNHARLISHIYGVEMLRASMGSIPSEGQLGEINFAVLPPLPMRFSETLQILGLLNPPFRRSL